MIGLSHCSKPGEKSVGHSKLIRNVLAGQIFPHGKATQENPLQLLRLPHVVAPPPKKYPRHQNPASYTGYTSRVLPFLTWGDFHPRSHFPRSTIPEEK